MPLTAILRSGDLDQLPPAAPSASIPYGRSSSEKRAARIQKA